MHWIALQPAPQGALVQAGQGAVGTHLGNLSDLTDPLSAWAWHALRFTPLVARLEDALVLEVSASERLFGGKSALLHQLFAQNQPLAPIQYAQGATSLIAFGQLQCTATTSTQFVDTHMADALPLHTLVAARVHLPTLTRLGVSTWGQLRALPRAGVARRFGVALLDALDCAYGHRPEVYRWITIPEVFDAPLELLASVELAPALLFGARRLLAQLQVWLRARQQGVLALELLWELDARRSNALHVDAHHHGGQQGRLELRTAQPTQDMQHLARLLGEQLASVHLPAPVLHLRLRSLQTQPLAGESLSLLPDDVRHGDSLHQLIERLSARLGAEQVRSATLHADHRPERMQHWHAADGSASIAIKSGASHASSTSASGHFYPTWLLATPQRLDVQQGQPQHHGSLTLLLGPQRLESGWLEGRAVLRDYYVARSEVAGLLWVYCERLGLPGCSPVWYLHGIFA